MTQNKKIAVTGGIGSGKSAACVLLKKMGYPVFSCDGVSRALWQDGAYRAGIAALFPDIAAGGEIDKKTLAARVFSDKAALKKLNAYSHPRIMDALFAEMNAREGVCFAEVPLLYEGGFEGLFDGVIALRRPRGERLLAVAARDGLTEGEIAVRMAEQFPPERLEGKGCYILENDGTELELEAKLKDILKKMGI